MNNQLSTAMLLILLTTSSVLAQPPNSTPAVIDFSAQASCGGDSCGVCGTCEDDVCTKKVRIYGITARANQMHDTLVTAVGRQIQFTSQVYQTGCNNLTYEWSFGDNETSDASDPLHAYKKPGNYVAKLKVKCDGNCDEKEDKVEEVVIVTVDLEADKVLEGIEESQGALVVVNRDGNNAPRHKVILHRAKPKEFAGKLILGRLNPRLRVFAVPEGGDELMNDENHEVKFINQEIPEEDPENPETGGLVLWVEGYKKSEKMRDAGLYVKVEDSPEVRDSVAFTALWVDRPAIKFSGDISPENGNTTRYVGLTAAGAKKVGLQLFRPSETVEWMGWGLETRASVHPREFDFPDSFPDSELRLETDVEFKWYNDKNFDRGGNFSDKKGVPPGNFTQLVAYYQDTVPNPNGFIYLLDNFSSKSLQVAPDGVIWRVRYNARAFASVLIGERRVRCSEVKEYFARFSIIQVDEPNGKNWVPLRWSLPGYVDGDNQASGGQTNLTWDLK